MTGQSFRHERDNRPLNAMMNLLERNVPKEHEFNSAQATDYVFSLIFLVIIAVGVAVPITVEVISEAALTGIAATVAPFIIVFIILMILAAAYAGVRFFLGGSS